MKGMEDDMRKVLVAALISVFITPTAGFAQTQREGGDRDLTIRISTIQPSTANVLEASRRQQPPRRSWAGRHPVIFGALIGLGVGLGVQAAVIPGASGGEPHSAYLPMFGGVGAGSGALVGWIVSVVR